MWRTSLERARPRGFASYYFDPKDVATDAGTMATFAGMITFARDQGWAVGPIGDAVGTWRRVIDRVTL